jgi:hypothetical protein
VRDALRRLEQDFADIQDVEFTIENGKLWMLQTRAAKRTLNRSRGAGGTADGQALHLGCTALSIDTSGLRPGMTSQD